MKLICISRYFSSY